MDVEDVEKSSQPCKLDGLRSPYNNMKMSKNVMIVR